MVWKAEDIAPIWRNPAAWFALAVAAWVFMVGVTVGIMNGAASAVVVVSFNAAFVVSGLAAVVSLWLDMRQSRKGNGR